MPRPPARLGTPADIAAAAAFLLGPESAFVSGTDLLVAGGVVAALRPAGRTHPADDAPSNAVRAVNFVRAAV